MTARLVFLGTPDAAVPTLQALADVHDVVRVITQPNRPRGRSGKPVPPPVKLAAEHLGIPVSQPETSKALYETIAAEAPFDAGVVVAYGRLLRPEVLAIPTHGFLNVHFSLLPRWRGAAPVVRALMAGDTMSGVSIIRLDEGLDTGPVLNAQAIDIAADEDGGDLTKRLAVAGARLLVDVLDPYLSGELVPMDQIDEGATYASKLTPADRVISTGNHAKVITDQVRALSPDPSATLDIDGVVHKVLEVSPASSGPARGRWEVVDGRPVFGVNDGWLEIVRLQPPGKPPRTGEEWVRGLRSTGGVVG